MNEVEFRGFLRGLVAQFAPPSSEPPPPPSPTAMAAVIATEYPALPVPARVELARHIAALDVTARNLRDFVKRYPGVLAVRP